MSRSNQTERPKNPAKYFLEWVSEKKCFQYYKKFNEEDIKDGVKGENVDVKLPFRFLVLDTLTTIKGWDDKTGSSYWSNEVSNITDDILIVKNKNGEVGRGTYSELQKNPNLKGIKFCKSVYIVMKENNDYILANIQFKGASLGQWIDFEKSNNIFKDGIEVSSFLEGNKGKTIFFMPVFKKMSVSEEANKIAVEYDKELQIYLKEYLNYSKKEDSSEIDNEDKNDNEDMNFDVTESNEDIFGTEENKKSDNDTLAF